MKRLTEAELRAIRGGQTEGEEDPSGEGGSGQGHHLGTSLTDAELRAIRGGNTEDEEDPTIDGGSLTEEEDDPTSSGSG